MRVLPRIRPRRISRWMSLGAAAIASALVLTGCAGSAETADSEEETAAVSVDIPSTPAGKKAQLILDALNAEDDTAAADWEGVFDEAFTDQVPLDQFAELLNAQIRPAQPFTAVAYTGDERRSVTTLESPMSAPIDMTIVVGVDDRVTGLTFTPSAAAVGDAPESFAELQERLEQFPATVHALVISADALEHGGDPILESGGDESAPLGSAFKLYVLYALAQAVGAGEVSWDDTLTVTDEVRSLPSGELQDRPNGTTVSVREAAEKMIAISDNTATDMIIQRLGRERVEAAVRSAGHHDPAQLTPFPSTREFFQIGWGDPSLLEQWRDADADQRRALLDRIATAPLEVTAAEIDANPVWLEGVEWFASARDLARVHLALDGVDDPEIRAILGVNPGIPVQGWSRVAFKGGSSPGVLTGTWLVESEDGERYLVIMQASTSDPAVLNVQQNTFFMLAQSALDLLRDVE